MKRVARVASSLASLLRTHQGNIDRASEQPNDGPIQLPLIHLATQALEWDVNGTTDKWLEVLLYLSICIQPTD